MTLRINYEQNTRKFYKPKESTLNVNQCLEESLTNPILDLIITENKMIIKFNDFTLEILSNKVFEELNDYLDTYFLSLKTKISTYAINHPPSEHPSTKSLKPVNRNPKFSPKLLITSLSLSAAILISGFAYHHTKTAKPSALNQETTSHVTNNPNYPLITLAFESRDTSPKLDDVIAHYGSIIEYYANRYGLPYEVICSQITQECPIIEEQATINICQIEETMLNESMHVPVYDENGFTGLYDDFTVTEQMLNTVEGNIQVGLARDRSCIDKYSSLLTGLFSYNQGINALTNACTFYGLDIQDYLGDENALKARDLINQYYQEGLQKKHGDPNYLENVFSYTHFEDREALVIHYYLGDELQTVELTNSISLENERGR